MAVRWMWAFIDTPVGDAETTWEFWRQVARAQLSARRGDHDQFATLLPAKGDAWLKVQAVDEGGGVHLDLDCDDPAGSAIRAIALGAREIHRFPGDSVVVMRSPGGFVFCLTTWAFAGHSARQLRAGEPDLIDQVCLDIPPGLVDREIAFWAALLDLPYVASDLPEFGSLQRPERLPLRLLFQRLAQGEGPVRGHLDLACVDRAASTRRHLDLGAELVAQHAFWTVLRDPAGATYCLTDRLPSPRG